MELIENCINNNQTQKYRKNDEQNIMKIKKLPHNKTIFHELF